jgi:pimeloyl-ACP methyl ester carboxylesterase
MPHPPDPNIDVADRQRPTIDHTPRAAGLPARVDAALWRLPADPGERSVAAVAGIPFSSLAWGHRGDRPLVLIHGVTASARVWWRIGPALAAPGRRVVAVDLPGHGRTGHWTGHHRFRDNAADVAAWIRAAELDRPDTQVVGHSWGAMTAAALPVAGIRPATLVLLEPPTIPFAIISSLATDPSEMRYRDLATAIDRLSAANPGWSEGDVEAKAEALVQLETEAARAVLVDNGDWDGGLSDLADPAAVGIPVRVIRGDPACGSLVPDGALAALAERVGADHITTIAGASHSPQRTHPAETTAAILSALD